MGGKNQEEPQMNTDGRGCFAARERKDRKRRRRFKRVLCRSAGDPWRDPIALAWAREREARRVHRWPGEYGSIFFSRAFKCVCCGRVRPDDQRREPFSQVCVSCVREAGFG